MILKSDLYIEGLGAVLPKPLKQNFKFVIATTEIYFFKCLVVPVLK